MIPYSRQYIDSYDIKEVVNVLKSAFITQGLKISEFEKSVAVYSGMKYAIAFSSGTAALHAAYYTVGVGDGDEVITSPLTFAATSNMVLAFGAKPIFADILLETGNLDPKKVEEKITRKTRAIVAVDYSGLPVDGRIYKNLAKKHGLVFIEDAAHSLGASYNKMKVGLFADMTMFSFHPVKSITTGEGGIIVTNNKEFYDKMILFRNHGITKDKSKMIKKNKPAWYYEMHDLGFNYRMTDIQAALGISQIAKLDRFIKTRREIAERYQKKLKNLKNFIVPQINKDCKSSWHLFPLRIISEKKHLRDIVFNNLQKAGIGVQVHYIPVYQHPYYTSLGYRSGLCPNAELFSASEISIPIFPSLSLKEQNFIIKVLQDLDNTL